MNKKADIGLVFLAKIIIAVIFVFLMIKIIALIIGLFTPSSASLASLEEIGEEIKILVTEVRGEDGEESSMTMPVQIDLGDCIRTRPDRICLHNNCDEEPYKCIELNARFAPAVIAGAKGVKTIKINAKNSGGTADISIEDRGGPMPATP